MNSQIDDKRTQFHKNIRAKQIQTKLKSLRDAYIQKQRTATQQSHANTYNVQNQVQELLNPEFKDANNSVQSSGHKLNPSKTQTIGKMLKTDSSWSRQHGGGQAPHLRSEVVKKIWQIALQANNQVCLGEDNMSILIRSALADVECLWKMEEANEKGSSMSQRVNRIVWTLLNQCSKCAQISVQIVRQISQLCLSLFNQCEQKKITSPRMCLPDPSLCILLLGNICVNEQHVKTLLSSLKLNKLITILDDILHPKYYEDLSFMLCNILYYYPHPFHHTHQLMVEDAQEQDQPEPKEGLLIKIKEEELQLLQVLWSLYSKLSEDMLITASWSIKKNDSCFYQTPSKMKSKEKLYTPVSKKKMSKNDYALLSLEEKDKTVWLLENKYRQVKLTNTYTHDLMECINKIKHVLLDLKDQQTFLLTSTTKQSNTEVIQELMEACRKLDQQINSKEKYVVVLIVRILHYQSQQNKKTTTYSFNFMNDREKTSFMTIFLRDIFRCFQSPTPRKHHSQTTLQLQQYIMSCKCEQLFKYIHKQILNDNEFDREYQTSGSTAGDKYFNSNIEDDIVDSLWELYGYMVKYMMRNRGNRNIHQASYGSLCDRELSVLENRLVSIHGDEIYEDRLCSQQARGLNLLAEYYQIANSTHVHANDRFSASNYEEMSCQSYVHIEIDMKQIQNLLSFLKNKLIQHMEAPTMIFAILRAIQTVVRRVRLYMSGSGEEETNQYVKTNLVKNKDLLGKQLYDLLLTSLAKYGEETAIGSQIFEIRSQLLNQDFQMQIQEDEEKME